MSGITTDPIKGLRVLVVDDEPANVLLLERVLANDGYPHVRSCTDPALVAAICRDWRPHLILLDLHMPGMDGFAVMSQLIVAEAGDGPTIVVLTADVTSEARRRALLVGARDFLVKPFDPVEVLARVHNLLENHYVRMQLQSQNERLAEQVAERTRELESARREILDRLALAAEYRDYSTGAHTQRVGHTARLLAQELELPDEFVEMLGDAAPLHDIGKLAIPDAILLKPGPLTADEAAIMKSHVDAGAAILRASHAPVLRLATELVAYHHERWDGSGYTARLANGAIPLSARITALADTFDAMTHDRPYQEATPPDEVLHEVQRQAGHQFDPALVDAFMRLDHAALL